MNARLQIDFSIVVNDIKMGTILNAPVVASPQAGYYDVCCSGPVPLAPLTTIDVYLTHVL